MTSEAAEPVASERSLAEREAIKGMFECEWGIKEPREAQVTGIQKLLSQGSHIHIQKTGGGKSLVFLGAATIRRRISICVIPFHLLGTDQMAKVNLEREGKSVVAIHADLIAGDGFRRIESLLLQCKKDSLEYRSIIIYVSAKAVMPGKPWHKLVEHLATQGLIRVVAFDEAHEIPLQGKEFGKEYANLVNVVEKHQKGVAAYLAMSSTFPLDLQSDFQEVMGFNFHTIEWGRMDRRNISISVSIVGNATAELKKVITPFIKDKSYKESKVLMYTGFAARASGSLLGEMKKHCGTESDAMAFTESTGIKEKSFLIDLFSGVIDEPSCKLQVLVAATTKCGISSNLCKLVACEGFPRSLLELVQVMGLGTRVLDETGLFAIVLTLDLYMELDNHIEGATDSSAAEKQRQRKELLEVLRFLLLPKQCQHVTLEKEFSDPDSTLVMLGSCGNACCYCRKDHKQFTGTFRRMILIETMQLAFFQGSVTGKHLYSVLNNQANKEKIWTATKTDVSAGMVQALILQLLASGILVILSDHKVSWAKEQVNGSQSFVYKDDHAWDGLTYE